MPNQNQIWKSSSFQFLCLHSFFLAQERKEIHAKPIHLVFEAIFHLGAAWGDNRRFLALRCSPPGVWTWALPQQCLSNMIIDQWYEFRWTLLWCWRHSRKAPKCFAAHPNKAIFPRKLLFCCWMHLCFWRKTFHFHHNSANEGEMCPVLAEDWESHLFRHRGFHYNAQCGFFCDYNVKQDQSNLCEF